MFVYSFSYIRYSGHFLHKTVIQLSHFQELLAVKSAPTLLVSGQAHVICAVHEHGFDIHIGKGGIFFQGAGNSASYQGRRHGGAAFYPVGIRLAWYTGHDLIAWRHNIRLTYTFLRGASA